MDVAQQESLERSHKMLDDLFRDGKIVTLDVGMWSGSKKLTPDMCGVDPEIVSNGLVSLGSVKLLPDDVKKRLRKPYGFAATLINSYGWKAPFGTPRSAERFIPDNALPHIDEKLHEFQTRFREEIARLIDDLPQIIEDRTDAWRSEARKIYRKVFPDGDAGVDLEEFTDNLVRKVRACYPTTEKLRRKFRFSWVAKEVRLPRAFEVEAQSIRSVIQEVQAVEQEERATKNRLRDMFARQEAEISDAVTEFREGCLLQARQEIFTLAERLRRGISDGSVRADLLSRCREAFERFQVIDFQNDESMREAVKNINDMLGSSNAKQLRGSTQDARRELANAIGTVSNDIADLTELVNRGVVSPTRRLMPLVEIEAAEDDDEEV